MEDQNPTVETNVEQPSSEAPVSDQTSDSPATGEALASDPANGSEAISE